MAGTNWMVFVNCTIAIFTSQSQPPHHDNIEVPIRNSPGYNLMRMCLFFFFLILLLLKHEFAHMLMMMIFYYFFLFKIMQFTISLLSHIIFIPISWSILTFSSYSSYFILHYHHHHMTFTL